MDNEWKCRVRWLAADPPTQHLLKKPSGAKKSWAPTEEMRTKAYEEAMKTFCHYTGPFILQDFNVQNHALPNIVRMVDLQVEVKMSVALRKPADRNQYTLTRHEYIQRRARNAAKRFAGHLLTLV